MRIRVLGCSGGIGPGLRTTSLLLDDKILIDAGTGVGDLSLREMSQIGHVFLTHSHLDHICGLAFMADNLFDEVEHPIEVMAAAPTIRAIREHLFNWHIWPDFSQLPSAENPLVRFHDFAPGTIRSLGEAGRLQSFEVQHTVPAVGYVLTSADGGVFAFSGDTGSSAAMWAFLNGLPRLDRLMIDIAFPDDQAELGVRAKHYTPGLLGRELSALRHRPELLLTHHKPGCEKLIDVECATALQGWRYRHLRRGDLIDF